jgi:hypothetical protein
MEARLNLFEKGRNGQPETYFRNGSILEQLNY